MSVACYDWCFHYIVRCCMNNSTWFSAPEVLMGLSMRRATRYHEIMYATGMTDDMIWNHWHPWKSNTMHFLFCCRHCSCWESNSHVTRDRHFNDNVNKNIILSKKWFCIWSNKFHSSDIKLSLSHHLKPSWDRHLYLACCIPFKSTTLLAKRLLHPHWRQWNQCGSNFCVSTWLKLAWYGPVIVPQRNPTLPWADIQCKVKWDRRAPKPQYRWSFPQINLHTVTTSKSIFAIFVYFSKSFSDCSNCAPSNSYGY